MSDQGAWVIGGTTLVGIGVGFFLLSTSTLFFVASILTGIGLGLVIAAFMPKAEKRDTETSRDREQEQT